MFSPEREAFEIEENYVEFQEICSRLKNHAFPSPWKIFFQKPVTDEFIPEVSEFVINDENALKQNFNLSTPLPVDDSFADVSKRTGTSNDVTIDKKKISCLRESLLSAQEENNIESLKEFDVFFTTSSSQMSKLFQVLDVLSLNDTAISLLLSAFLNYKDLISVAIATSLVHHVVCPLIFDMKRNSSRFLLTTILKFAEVYPKAMVDEVIIPFSKEEKSDDVQSEILLQISKTNLPKEYVSYTIKNVLDHALPVENSFAVLQCLIERKVHHETALYDILLKKLLSWTSTCNKSIKFTKLLTSILSAYGNELTDQQIQLCDEVVKSNKTIIKKAAENLLKRLKHENA